MGKSRGRTMSSDAFISIMAGRHIFKPKTDSQPSSIGKKLSPTPFSSPVLLYRYGEKGKWSEREGFYVGNRIYYKYFNGVGYVSTDVDKSLKQGFDYSNIGGGEEILQNAIPDFLKRMEQGVKMKIRPDKVPSPSEQTGKGEFMIQQAPTKGGGSANPVDITTFGGDHYQVTFQKLSDANQHGIYGNAGKRLNADIRKLEAKYNTATTKKRGILQKMANKGLRYFQNRLIVWNKQMAHIQKHFPTHTGTAKGLRGTMDYVSRLGKQATGTYGFGLPPESTRAFNRMRGKPTGYFTENAGKITRTALGNMSEFGGRGGTYTFQLTDYAYTHLSKFKMLSDPRFRWDTRALNKALVVQGHTELAGLLASDSINLDEQGIAMRQFHGQIAYETSKSDKDIKSMTVQNQLTSSMNTAGGRIYPSIDLVAADENFAKYVRDTFVPIVEDEFKRSSQKLDRRLGEGKSFTHKRRKFWALPYLSIADYDIRRHGLD